jgi:UDPglucose 6-dehydrogenase
LNEGSQNIAIIGSGYVGMSLAVLLSQKHNINIIDIDEEKVEKINLGISPIKDELISEYLAKKNLKLHASTPNASILEISSIIIIATPTDFDEKTNKFDTSSVDRAIDEIIKKNIDSTIVIKSTIPEGHTELLQEKYNNKRIIFSPEFLREGNALYDNLYPSRIVVGSKCEHAKAFANLLRNASLKKEVKTLFTSSREAEAIKLFSNTYLALRVAFFNELDTYAMSKGLNSKDIITGLSLDKRIGDHYNNPSFGYGGYCLPKDTKQLLTNFSDIPQDLIKSVISSNSKRKIFMANAILETESNIIGFYKLAMKKDSDNFRSSSILDVIKLVRTSGKQIIIFEPNIDNKHFLGIEIDNNLKSFKDRCDLIVTNRTEKALSNVQSKVFTRDIFKEN